MNGNFLANIFPRKQFNPAKELKVCGLVNVPNKAFMDELLTFREKNVIDILFEITPAHLPDTTPGLILNKGQQGITMMCSVMIFYQDKDEKKK